MKTKTILAASAAALAPIAVTAQVALGAAAPTGPTGVRVVSSIRESDPTILDAKYVVYGENGATAKVRALAFENGERSIGRVVRPKTFVEDPDGNPTKQNIGDAIPCNTEVHLSWKVPADWDADLARLNFDILVTGDLPLPLDLVAIPEDDPLVPGLVVTTNTQTDDDVFNALLWHYASGTEGLALDGDDLYVDGMRVASQTSLTSKFLALRWLYGQAGFRVLDGDLFAYVKDATRLAFGLASPSPYAYEVATAPETFFVGADAYCSIDLSGGPDAESYPVAYLDSVPTSGWDDLYRTTNLLLRLVPAGTFRMQGNRPVTLTRPFYLGVFEVTQKQWELVCGSNPSDDGRGDTYPVENISWDDIRGRSAIYDWPTVAGVDTNSFAGRISARTGLNFDLPTEAQWEYACRAGGETDPDYRLVARSSYTAKDGRVSRSVGSYCANDWGLFDMRGSVWEWTLDRYGPLEADAVTDPTGADSGEDRVFRGGSYVFSLYNGDSTSSIRESDISEGISFDLGFRLSRTLP